MAWKKTDDEIIAYLSDELTPSEKAAFEQRLQTDTALSEAMERHLAFEDKLRDYGVYREKTEEISQLNQQFTQTQVRQKFFRYASLAAAVLAFLIVVILVTQGNKAYCPQELYAEVFEVRVAPDIAGQGQDAEQVLRIAHSRFSQQLPDEAAEGYQKALDAGSLSTTQKDEAAFFLGQTFMLRKDFESALNSFGNISGGPYQQLSQWYTALSHLALGQVEEAQPILAIISQNKGHDRQAEAVMLLGKWKTLTLTGCE